MIALTGRRDQPTDAVEDYCRYLAEALRARGVQAELTRVAWDEGGWLRALGKLWRKSSHWKGDWTLAQYTALMWSRRGFPWRFLLVLTAVKIRGTCLAVVFHDVQPFGGVRVLDKLRRACQRFVMRRSYGLSAVSILPVPLEQANWLPPMREKACYIPVGANLPADSSPPRAGRDGREFKTVAVFGITDGGDISQEVFDITSAAKRAAEGLPHVRLVTVGRGSLESEARFRQALEGSTVEFTALGVLPPADVSKALAAADVALFVRGPISTQRGTAIASIAHAVPLVAYAGPSLPTPLAEAGVIGVPYRNHEELASATLRVLTNPELWNDLHQRSRRAYEQHFAWDAVAGRVLEALRRG